MSIVFYNPDTPEAARSLANVLVALSPGDPILGLIVKVQDDGGEGRVINWMFADVNLLKSLAIVLPGREPDFPKE